MRSTPKINSVALNLPYLFPAFVNQVNAGKYKLDFDVIRDYHYPCNTIYRIATTPQLAYSFSELKSVQAQKTYTFPKLNSGIDK